MDMFNKESQYESTSQITQSLKASQSTLKTKLPRLSIAQEKKKITHKFK